MFRQILRRPSSLPVSRRRATRRRLLEACRTMAAPLVAILAMVQPSAEAASVISGLNYTGANIPVGSGGQDANWKVAAVPVDGSISESVPYKAWVFSGLGTPIDPASWVNVPDPWYSGHTNVGFAGGRWIGAQENDATSLLPDFLGTSYAYYTTIYSTTFQASETGSAPIWFKTAADNAVTFFVNGSITGATSNRPTITGGQQVGSRMQGLATLKTVFANVNVTAGTNTLYAVVEDIWNPSTHTYGYTGLIVVPEPSTMSSVGMAGAGAAIAAAGRRLRRRPRN